MALRTACIRVSAASLASRRGSRQEYYGAPATILRQMCGRVIMTTLSSSLRGERLSRGDSLGLASSTRMPSPPLPSPPPPYIILAYIILGSTCHFKFIQTQIILGLGLRGLPDGPECQCVDSAGSRDELPVQTRKPAAPLIFSLRAHWRRHAPAPAREARARGGGCAESPRAPSHESCWPVVHCGLLRLLLLIATVTAASRSRLRYRGYSE